MDGLHLMPLTRQNEFGQWRANFQDAGGDDCDWEVVGKIRTIAAMREKSRDAILLRINENEQMQSVINVYKGSSLELIMNNKYVTLFRYIGGTRVNMAC
jgi:hypothetical protein